VQRAESHLNSYLLTPFAQRDGCTCLPSARQSVRRHGYDFLKAFPAAVIGGTRWLQAMHGPFPAAQFCATGGITTKEVADYLSQSNVLCVGGSWMTPRDVVQEKNWTQITALARAAHEAVL
jgi:Entner-Doudoroff aldolase